MIISNTYMHVALPKRIGVIHRSSSTNTPIYRIFICAVIYYQRPICFGKAQDKCPCVYPVGWCSHAKRQRPYPELKALVATL